MSGARILALPTPLTSLASSVFFEAMAAHLCVLSPAVVKSGHVGRISGRGGSVEQGYGDKILNCNDIPGDSQRQDGRVSAIP